jgi:dephospho-CoA kinase
MNFEYAIALTGGIATGKSTVASFLTMYGFKKIDADAISHTILDRFSLEVADIFGTEFLINDKIDRKKLGKLIFEDITKRKILEEFLHPKIKEEITNQANKLDLLKSPYLIDIPLFFEKKNYDIKRALLIYVDSKIQLQRLIKRENYTQDEAILRIGSQMNIDKKLDLIKKMKYGFVIDNSKDLEHLQKECEEFKKNILKTF